MPLSFNYMIDSELRVPIGNLPTGINTQAIEMAANRMSRRFRETQQMLKRKVPGIGASPYAGMTPAWHARLQAESAWVASLVDRISDVAEQVADASNAEAQGSMRELWNRWAPEVLKVYSLTLRAYQKDVGFAMSNQAVTGVPPVYAKMAHLLKMDAPDLNPVALSNGLSGGCITMPGDLGAFTDDDAAYLADLDGLDTLGNMFLLGGAALVGGLWWMNRRNRGW